MHSGVLNEFGAFSFQYKFLIHEFLYSPSKWKLFERQMTTLIIMKKLSVCLETRDCSYR